MEPSEYEAIARLEATHWWYQGMRRISSTLLEEVDIQTGALILDAGCGPGGTSAYLSRYGRVVGMDIAKDAIDLAKRHELLTLVRGSVGNLPFADDTFDVVTSFDVLYHRAVGDDRHAVEEATRVLRYGGWFLIRLPAFELLRSDHDRIVHTERRYTARQVKDLLPSALSVRRITYLNTILSPIALAKRSLERLRSTEEPASDVRPAWPPINALLLGALRLESVLVRRWNMPFGVSICCLAQKV